MISWKTHSKCCTCKQSFLKTELIDGTNCIECNEANKLVKLDRKQITIVTKRKACKCSKCNTAIKVGAVAVAVKIELTHGNDYTIYYHEDCVKFI